MRNKRRMDETGAMTARKTSQGFLDVSKQTAAETYEQKGK
jgi:hypothetical protein